MNTNILFGWDRADDIPTVILNLDKAASGAEFEAFGADDEKANTQLAVKVAGKRELTLRPEPMMMMYFRRLIEAEKYLLIHSDETKEVVELTDEETESMQEMVEDLKVGLEDAPLGGL